MYNNLIFPPQVEDEMIQCIVCEDWYHSRVSYMIVHLSVFEFKDFQEVAQRASSFDFLVTCENFSLPALFGKP